MSTENGVSVSVELRDVTQRRVCIGTCRPGCGSHVAAHQYLDMRDDGNLFCTGCGIVRTESCQGSQCGFDGDTVGIGGLRSRLHRQSLIACAAASRDESR